MLSAPAGAAEVRVRCTTRIETAVSAKAEEIELSGQVQDELGKPVGPATLTLELRPEAPTADPMECQGASIQRRTLVRRGPRQEYLVTADSEGRFCAALPESSRGATLRVRYPGDQLREPSELVSLKLEPPPSSLELRFAPRPHELSLERSLHRLGVTSRLEPAPPGPAWIALELALAGEGKQLLRLASTIARAGEPTKLEVESSRLGMPGPATLILRSPGSELVGPAEHRVRVERTARVQLSLTAKGRPRIENGRVEIGVAVLSVVGKVPSGSVEATAGVRSLGAAPVVDGAALLVLEPGAHCWKDQSLLLRYVPTSPWWIPGEPLVVTLRDTQRGRWQGIGWALGAVAVVGWMLSTWWRPRSRCREPDHKAQDPVAEPSVQLARAGPPGGGWSGMVKDAHDGRPLPGATLEVVVGGFGSSTQLACTKASDRGQFCLPPLKRAAAAARLEVSSRWHQKLVRPLPPPGVLVVTMVSRRRALLERLLAWARRMGPPWWAGRREPTPGEVLAVAERLQAQRVALWVRSVERAAYGPDPVDAEAEDLVLKLEPGGQGPEETQAVDSRPGHL